MGVDWRGIVSSGVSGDHLRDTLVHAGDIPERYDSPDWRRAGDSTGNDRAANGCNRLFCVSGGGVIWLAQQPLRLGRDSLRELSMTFVNVSQVRSRGRFVQTVKAY